VGEKILNLNTWRSN